MAHSCPFCGQMCYCNGDIDDCCFDGTEEQDNCTCCGGEPDDYCEGNVMRESEIVITGLQKAKAWIQKSLSVMGSSDAASGHYAALQVFEQVIDETIDGIREAQAKGESEQ